MTIGQPHAAASIRFWPPSGAKLPAEEGDVGERVPGRHLEHRVAEPHLGVFGFGGTLVAGPGAAPRQREAGVGDQLGDGLEALRMARHDDQQRPRCGDAPPRREQHRLLAFTRRRGDDDAAAEAGAPGSAASEQAGVGGDVVFQVADDADLAHAGVAQAGGVGLGLRQRRGQALERRPQQRIDAPAALSAALAHARVGEQDRNAARRRDGEQVRPDLGFHQHADRRIGVLQEAAHRTGHVERQPELEVARAQQGLSGSAAGGGAMGQQDASARSRCAQCVEERRGSAGLAERDRMHPDRPRRHRLAIEAEALAGRAGVGRLAPAAPLHAQQVQRRDQAQQQRIGGARRAATGSAAHGVFGGERPAAVRAALCTPFQAAHTAATVGTGSPSTATWRPPLWRACGPVRHEVGKL
jgi:hypothetical protein